jgi:hypothetical protein
MHRLNTKEAKFGTSTHGKSRNRSLFTTQAKRAWR